MGPGNGGLGCVEMDLPRDESGGQRRTLVCAPLRLSACFLETLGSSLVLG